MNINEATRSYEKWMRSCTAVLEADLAIEAQANERKPVCLVYGQNENRALTWICLPGVEASVIVPN
jgi:hypothetical protein